MGNPLEKIADRIKADLLREVREVLTELVPVITRGIIEELKKDEDLPRLVREAVEDLTPVLTRGILKAVNGARLTLDVPTD